MAASVLESSAAFSERALSIGVEQWIVDKFSEKHFASFGKLAFAIPYTPQNADDTPFKQFIEDIIEQPPSQDQLATLRRLFFEAHTMALSDVRSRVEATPDPAVAVKRLPTAERVARQADQEKRLGGIIFTPDVIPSNHIVDLFVEMCESGILTYLKPEQCCSRSMEVSSFKKDPTISTDSSGMLKIGNKHSDITCDAGTELKLRAAWQRRSLAMDLAGLATFSVVESWVQYLFTHLTREQPRGFAKVTLNQLLECDKRLFTIASHRTMGGLKGEAGGDKPLDEIIQELGSSHEILQYLTPYPQVKGHDPPPRGSDEDGQTRGPRGTRVQRMTNLKRLDLLRLHHVFRSQMDAAHMMIRTDHYASSIRLASVHSKGRRVSAAPRVFTSVTRLVATGTDRFINATTVTDLRRNRYHP